MEQLNTVIFDIVIEFLLIFLLYSDTIKTSLYKFYTCAVIFFFSVVLLYVLPNIASPLIDFFLEMLLVFILLTDNGTIKSFHLSLYIFWIHYSIRLLLLFTI